MFRAVAFLLRHRPSIMVLQWWTGTVLHSYVVLAVVARLLGARIVIEFHEVLDTGEARMPVVRRYVQALAPLVMRMASAFTVHSAFDRDLVTSRNRLNSRVVHLVPIISRLWTPARQDRLSDRLPQAHATCSSSESSGPTKDSRISLQRLIAFQSPRSITTG